MALMWFLLRTKNSVQEAFTEHLQGRQSPVSAIDAPRAQMTRDGPDPGVSCVAGRNGTQIVTLPRFIFYCIQCETVGYEVSLFRLYLIRPCRVNYLNRKFHSRKIRAVQHFWKHFSSLDLVLIVPFTAPSGHSPELQGQFFAPHLPL